MLGAYTPCSTPICARARSSLHQPSLTPSLHVQRNATTAHSPLLAARLSKAEQRERVRVHASGAAFYSDSADVVPQTNEEYEDDEGRA